MDRSKPPQRLGQPQADALVRATARRLVAAGLVLCAANAVIAGAREALASGPDTTGRAIASAVLAGIPVVAAARWRSAVLLLEREDRWLIVWSLVAVAAFAIDGPGDQLLLPAALAPVGMAGLVGRPRRAIGCAAIVDIGFLAVFAAHGPAAWRGDGLHLAAEDAILVWLTVAITALPVKLALKTAREAPWLVAQLRLNGGSSFGPLPAGPAPRARLLGGAPPCLALPLRATTPDGPLLDDQERRVLLMLRDGHPYKVIAIEETRILGRPCSKHRVYRIVGDIKRKVGVRTRNQLARLDDTEFGL